MRTLAGIAGIFVLLHTSTASAAPGDFITSLLRLPLPLELELCGERVPLEREDVAERLELELMVALANPLSTTLWFKRRTRFFPLVETRIREEALPLDLRYVPVVESNLRAEAVSRARAVGPWQFMRSTGKNYGLERNTWRDDRRNWEEATAAGLRHLKDLYGELGSWSLALAAYNAGKKRVVGAMAAQGQSDFYGLTLPRETERYVFRIMAAKLILERPEDFGINLEGARFYPSDAVVDSKIEVIRSRLPLAAVAAAAGVSYRRLKSLNAWMIGDALPQGTHRIKIPAAAEATFGASLARWEAEHPEPEVFYHRVRRGDTLSGIANRYGVRVADLMAWNALGDSNLILPGQRIAVRRTR